MSEVMNVGVMNVGQSLLSSLHIESSWAGTGRQCPPSGVWEDFLARCKGPLTKTAVTWKRKVAK